MMGVPLISRDAAIGVLYLYSRKIKAYTDRDLKLTQGIAAQIAGAIANAQLFRERKRAEEALRKSEEKFRDLYDSAPVGYHEYDTEGRVTNVNYTDLEMLGYCREEMIGEYIWTFNVGEDVVRQQVLEKLQGRRPPGRSLERTYRRKDGTTFPVLIEDRLNKDEQGRITGIRCTIQDITERKKAEEALRQREKELNEQAQQLQKELTQRRRVEEELARSNKELEQLAYVASHDLQEPLRMVTSYVQLLARRYRGKLDGDADEFIGFAVNGAARMQQLINDLLTYSRVGTRGREFEPTDCEIILGQVLKNLQVAIEEKQAIITHDPLPVIMADNVQLGQLFQNLIGNAIKFQGTEPPRIHVSASLIGNAWVFSVCDNGIGIAPEYAERIFVIFQRLHTQEKYPGTGIGLALCKKIVERHGGHIWVESEPGKGATFYFTVPMKGEQ
jgi:PAS domain S-box-containing protein